MVILTTTIFAIGALGSFVIFKNPVGDVKSWMEHRGDIYRLNLPGVHIEPFELLTVPFNWIRSFLRAPEIPHLAIDIKFKHMQKLHAKREAALAKGILVKEDTDYVPARIRLGENQVKAELRLKGDYLDHLTNDKWAFRIHIKGKDHLFGMRRFSIHHPMGRDYHGEPLFFSAMRDEGILTPRYFFVDVSINGDFIGRMALEEHFSAELLAAQQRRESVIVRFDESLVWDADDGAHRGFKGVFDNIANTQVRPFRESRVLRSDSLTQELEIASGLLRGFANGTLPASQVFDTELLGRFIAVAETWGAFHCLAWNNQRFYYNSVTARLEPIAYDGNVGHAISSDELINRRYAIVTKMLADPLVWESYARTLKKWAQVTHDEALSQKLRLEEAKHLETLHKYYPFLRKWHLRALADRARTLLDRIESEGGNLFPNYPKVVHAYLLSTREGQYLELANAIPQRVEIRSIEWSDSSGKFTKPFQTERQVRFPIRLPATTIGTPPASLLFRYELPSQMNPELVWLNVQYRIQGQERLRTTQAVPYYPPLAHNPIPDTQLDDLLKRHSFIAWDTENKQIKIKSGVWKVRGPLILPTGIPLTVSPQTTLQFTADGAFIVRGPVVMHGTADAPIILEAQAADNSKTGSWQGLAVLHALQPSSLRHVTVRNTAGINQNGWKLTGGVTFYDSPVRIEQSRFTGNQAEDAVNIIRSEFTLTEIVIVNAQSDGLDIDFSEGSVNRGTFAHIGSIGGGDAIDLSGSNVRIDGSTIFDVADKGLSVGEGSTLSAHGLDIRDSMVGAASKDGSHLILEDTTFTDIRHIGLMAYIKKPEYGAGSVSAKRLHFRNVPQQAKAQKGNVIQIDAHEIVTEDLDVQDLYKTTMKPGRKR